MKKELMIIGAGGHGRVIADIAKRNGYNAISFLDDNDMVKSCGGYPVVGRTAEAVCFPNADFIVAIGKGTIRERVQTLLMEKCLRIPVLIHPNAVVAEDAVIGAGSVIMAGAVVNPGTVVGKGTIVNTCASVDHDCQIGDFAHISPGAHIAGTVTIGDRTWVGVGAAVSNNLEIAADCVIGAGTVVVRNIEERGTYVGVPAMKL